MISTKNPGVSGKENDMSSEDGPVNAGGLGGGKGGGVPLIRKGANRKDRKKKTTQGEGTTRERPAGWKGRMGKKTPGNPPRRKQTGG